TEAVLEQMVTSMIDLPSSITLTPPPSSATPVQPLLSPSSKLPSPAVAVHWVVEYASPQDGPPATVIRVELMTLTNAMAKANNQSWANSGTTSADSDAPVWVIEVVGASIDHSCPYGTTPADCQYNHVMLVVDANTGQFVGLIDPHSDPATPVG
ncbi:MAG: hypothetical protein WBW04_08005, partial [Nitrolancea sp.]